MVTAKLEVLALVGQTIWVINASEPSSDSVDVAVCVLFNHGDFGIMIEDALESLRYFDLIDTSDWYQ